MAAEEWSRWDLGTALSGHSAPGSCPVDTVKSPQAPCAGSYRKDCQGQKMLPPCAMFNASVLRGRTESSSSGKAKIKQEPSGSPTDTKSPGAVWCFRAAGFQALFLE